MFLSLLSEKEKLKFLDLAVYMINVDGDADDAEQRLLNSFFLEVESIRDEYTFSKSESAEDTIAFFKESNQVVKNIVYLNLAKITMIDDLYNTEELLFLEDLEKKLNISLEKRHELMSIVYEERDLKEKASRIIKRS